MRPLRVVLTAALFIIASAAPASAENWGAGIPPREDERCTEGSRFSQCTADSATESIYIAPYLNSLMTTALENSIQDDYDAIPSIIAFRTYDFAYGEGRIYESNDGPVSWRGYTTCEGGSTKGESGWNMWCEPQLMFLNSYYEQSEWNNSGVIRKWLSCHELGHFFGLQHANANRHPQYWDESCMRTGDITGPPDLRDSTSSI